FGLEPEVADAAAPRRDDAADRPEIAAVRVLLVETADDVGRDANEGAQRRRAADRVLAAVPRAAEDERDLLEVIDEKLLRFLVHLAPAAGEDAPFGKQLLQLLRERRLRHAAAADAEHLDLIVQRRILAVVQRPHDVVPGRQGIVAIELPAGQADEMRG